MAAERGPGFERLVAQWSEAEHRAALARSDARYLVGHLPGAPPAGFVILEHIGDRHEGVKLKRVAVTSPGTGFGQALLAAVVDWVFENTRDERLWLDVFTYNERARHVYRRLGFVEDGLLRQAYLLPDGTRADRVIMSMLRSEWAAR
jgi:diamine N-acetyltransferase